MPANRSLTVAIIAVAAVACNAERRCQEISLQEVLAQGYERQQQQTYEAMTLAVARGLDVSKESAVQSWQRRYWAAEAARFRARMRREHPRDTSMWRPPIDPNQDSAGPTVYVPPRPSDREWYAEHCYQGHAR